MAARFTRVRLRPRWFLWIVIGPAAAISYSVPLLNVYVDPLWVVPQLGDRPFLYCVKDERQNRVNRIIHGRVAADGLVLGSSRAAFINPAFFRDNAIFNLAVNGVKTSEFVEYSRIFAAHRGQPKKVYAAFDFWGYVDQDGTGGEGAVQKARAIEAEAADPGYPIKQVLDWEVGRYSLEVLGSCSSPSYRGHTFRYDGTRHAKPVHYDLWHEQLLLDQAVYFAETLFSDAKFKADWRFREQIAELERVLPTSEIVPLVLPITADLFLAEMAEGRLDDYFAWLEMLIQEFGSVRYFAGLNAFTRNVRNFLDAHHVQGDLTKAIADILEGRVEPRPDGFGQRLTAENFPRFRQALREQVCREARPLAGGPETVRGCPQQPLSPGETHENTAFVLSVEPRNWRGSMKKKLPRVETSGAALVISSQPGTTEYQIETDVIAVEPGKTYIIDFDIAAQVGQWSVGALDAVSERWITLKPIGKAADRRVFKAPTAQVQLVIALGNSVPIASRAEIRRLALLKRTRPE